MSLARVGTVSKAAGGLAIVRCPDEAHPEIGTPVIDESLSDVGRVVDVFGPTERPYVGIAPKAREPNSLVEETLYTRSQ